MIKSTTNAVNFTHYEDNTLRNEDGGVGAVVGALTSKKVNKKHVDKLVLQIVVNDLNNPVYQVNFLRNSMSKESKSYQEIFNKANHWYKLLSVIIKRNDELDQQAIIN